MQRLAMVMLCIRSIATRLLKCYYNNIIGIGQPEKCNAAIRLQNVKGAE